jgi:gliding motility-associated-like protein
MNKYFLFILLFFNFINNTFSQKILGGEMYWREKSPTEYYDTLELILYTKNVLLESQFEVVYIYALSSGINTYGVALNRTSEVYELKNDNNVCTAQNGVKVFKQSYKGIIISANSFPDPKGSLIVFDRYQRDNVLENITGGQAFSIVTQIKKFDSKDLISPSFQPNRTENFLQCVGKEFTIDASALDLDGYSVKYGLSKPIKGYTKLNAEDPILFSHKPKVSYLEWPKGYSEKKPFGDNSKLKIDSKTGLITGFSDKKGIFGFTIKFEQLDKNGKITGFATKDMFIMFYDCPKTTTLKKPEIKSNGQFVKELEICPGEKRTFQVDFDSRLNYQWKKDNIVIPFENQEMITIDDAGKYSVNISSRDNCMLPAVSDFVNVKIKNITPEINAPYNDRYNIRDCAGKDIKLSIKNNVNNFKIEWSRIASTNGYDTLFQISNEITLKSSPNINFYSVWARFLNTGCSNSSISDQVAVYSLDPTKFSFPTLNWKKDTLLYICPNEGSANHIPQYFDYNFPDYQMYHNDKPANYELGEHLLFEGKYYFRLGYEGCYQQTNDFYTKYTDSCYAKKSSILAPTVFSPNGDLINDIFELFNLANFPDFELLVFDRWGKMVFYNKGYTEKFDGTFEGKLLPEGIYSYKIIHNDGYLEDKTGAFLLQR